MSWNAFVIIINALRYSLWVDFPAVLVFLVLAILLICAILVVRQKQKQLIESKCLILEMYKLFCSHGLQDKAKHILPDHLLKDITKPKQDNH